MITRTIQILFTFSLLILFFSCDEENVAEPNLDPDQDYLAVQQEAGAAAKSFYQELDAGLKYSESIEAYHTAAVPFLKRNGFFYEDFPSQLNGKSELFCPECIQVVESAENIEEIKAKLSLISKNSFEEIRAHGDDGTKAELITRIEFYNELLTQYQLNPEPMITLAINLGVDESLLTGKLFNGRCFASVLGGTLLGGLAGCKLGAEIGIAIANPHAIVGGCSVGAIIGGVAGAVASYTTSDACK